MPKIKTTYKARGVTVELEPESIGKMTPALVQRVLITHPSPITPTDLARGCAAILKEMNLREAKAKRKASDKTKSEAKKEKAKARKGGKAKVIAEARAPRKRKTPQLEMFPDAPNDRINPENMEEYFPIGNYESEYSSCT